MTKVVLLIRNEIPHVALQGCREKRCQLWCLQILCCKEDNLFLNYSFPSAGEKKSVTGIKRLPLELIICSDTVLEELCCEFKQIQCILHWTCGIRPGRAEKDQRGKRGVALLFRTVYVSGLVLIFVLSQFKPESSGTLCSSPVLSSRMNMRQSQLLSIYFPSPWGSPAAL